MTESVNCDIAIIGAGSGGLSVAAVAAQLGLHVVLVESEKMGGDCLNTGCVPSKSLLAAAKSVAEIHKASEFGIDVAKVNVNFINVMEHVSTVINSIAPHDSVERFTALGARVIKAQAQFCDPKTIIAGNVKIKARKFVIATGSTPAIPPIPGINEIPYLTNETIFQLREQPAHLIIIGAGPIGCELAQAFSLLGSKVTILEALTMMPRDEPELVEIMRQQLHALDIVVHENTKVNAVKKQNDHIHVAITHNGCDEDIIGTHLLVAAGRRAHVNDLNLEQAKVRYTAKGIDVDSRLRTTNKNIYAIGDVVGPYLFTHMANYHAGIVIRNIIFKTRAVVDYRVVPWVTYTHPELAHVGLTEAEAQKKGTDIRIIMLDLADNDRAKTENIDIGKIKVVVTKKGKILGASMLAPNAGELILPWIMLIKENKTLRSLTDVIIPYPTLSETSKTGSE